MNQSFSFVQRVPAVPALRLQSHHRGRGLPGEPVRQESLYHVYNVPIFI